MWIFILGGFLSGFFKSVRDTVKDHWARALFNNFCEPWRTWFRSDWRDKSLPYPITDAWHFSDFLSYICTGVFLFQKEIYLDFMDAFLSGSSKFLLFFVTMSVTFQLFYKVVLIKMYEKIYRSLK